MNERINDKIQQIMQLAKSPVEASANSRFEGVRNKEDSLLKSIRDTNEAAIFMSELETVIELAKSK